MFFVCDEERILSPLLDAMGPPFSTVLPFTALSAFLFAATSVEVVLPATFCFLDLSPKGVAFFLFARAFLRVGVSVGSVAFVVVGVAADVSETIDGSSSSLSESKMTDSDFEVVAFGATDAGLGADEEILAADTVEGTRFFMNFPLQN